MKVLKIIGIVVVIIVLILGYLGFVPGVSALFGSDKPRDLGVPHTEADRTSANAKLQQTIVELTANADPQTTLRSGASTVDALLTQPEIAAHLEEMHPVRDLQVKISANGTTEVAGRIDTGRIPDFLRLLGLSSSDQLAVLSWIDRYLPGQPAFYGRGQASIINHTPALTLERVELGRLPVSSSWVESGMEDYTRVFLNHVPNLSIETMTVANGQVRFTGTTPKEVPSH